jgi:adenylate cyclase
VIDVSGILKWLTQDAIPEPGPLVSGLVERLLGAGIPVGRFRIGFLTRHPEIWQIGALWEPGQPVRIVPFTYQAYSEASRRQALSPIASVVIHGEAEVRRRLDAAAVAEFPPLTEMVAAGMTDYFVAPLVGSGGARTFYSAATDAPGGFTDEHLAALRAIRPLLSLRAELAAVYDATHRLLEVYLGKNASRRVMAGAFRRGGGEVLRAVLFTCDLRGFTSLVDQKPVAEVVQQLDAHFERVAKPLSAAGGEILKFVGDAILAIFPLGDDAAGACHRALEASAAALDAVADDGQLRIGVGLHLGEVMYGNVGAAERLDFTAIGAAVNEVCRVEALCKELATPLLMTSTFAHAHGVEGLQSLGKHALRGVAQPAELFTLPRFSSPAGARSR